MPFQKGQSGNPGGRPRGAENKATADIKAFAHKVFSSRAWCESAVARMEKGTAPHLETYLLQLYAGKPKDRLELEDRTPRALIIDRVRTRAELVAALGEADADAGATDDDED